ncbi:MAG: acyl--CoA ligase [Desulfomonile tiedjei]|uniref:Acyl--CoA ligase n=1 Tax=Desulfomonile tiedjei TaxID=2358 RepID=A0A9D6V1Q1_9BACT|nr:acyl--CoA ligase [Desulfomonile tiedjei]
MMAQTKGKKEVVAEYDVFDGLNFRQLLEKTANAYPDKEALVYKDKRVSYREFNENVDKLATEFQRIGIQKEDCCAVLLPNSLEATYVQYAILKLGAIFIGLSTRYRKFELTYMLKHSEAKALVSVDEFMGTNFLDLLEEIKAELPHLNTFVVQGKNVPPNVYSLEGLFAKHTKPAILHADQVDENAIASILYTSGSTGRPKGITSTHRNIIWNAIRVCERLSIAEPDSFLMMLPLSHVFASLVLLTHAIMLGCKTVIMDVFEPEEALRLIEEEKISILYGVPTMFVMMLNHPNFKKYDLSSLRTGYLSGATCPPDLVRSIIDDMGCSISQAYGMAETCCMCVSEYGDTPDIKAETCGYPLRDVEVRVVDEEGKECPVGQVGEFVVRGDNVTRGYYKAPELNREAFDEEGWFHSGDLGLEDDNGRYRFVGRKKEMITRGGFHLFPVEIEEVICQFPSVQFAAVVGLPDKIMTEISCACVMPKPGQEIEVEALKTYLKANLARNKLPDRIEVFSDLPMTTTNKILKYQLVEDLILQGRPIDKK